jgi:hypothetical protein
MPVEFKKAQRSAISREFKEKHYARYVPDSFIYNDPQLDILKIFERQARIMREDSAPAPPAPPTPIPVELKNDRHTAISNELKNQCCTTITPFDPSYANMHVVRAIWGNDGVNRCSRTDIMKPLIWSFARDPAPIYVPVKFWFNSNPGMEMAILIPSYQPLIMIHLRDLDESKSESE